LKAIFRGFSDLCFVQYRAHRARRLRARSFRVLALTRLVASIVAQRFRDAAARLFYSAGGRFLVVANPCLDWHLRLKQLQCELDNNLLESYRGELVFHLAAAEFADGKIPVRALQEAMSARKTKPLGGVLNSGGRWSTDRFTFPAAAAGKCDGCGATAMLHHEPERLCQTCVDDLELGKALLLAPGQIALTPSPNGLLELLGARWGISSTGEIPIPLISHMPLQGHEPATFEQLAARAAGRRYLAYLRIDADKIGETFRNLGGDASRTWGLSTLLDHAFSSAVSKLMAEKFPDLYPVYGGGDDLFVIGPWNRALDFAAAWHSEFRSITDNKLTFSAGMALAKARQHILTKAEEANYLLEECAKVPRDSIHVLGETIRWAAFDEALVAARQLADMYAKQRIRSALLEDILKLHERWRKGDERWHSLLFYQIERNLGGEEMSFIRRAFLSPGNLWKHAGFVVRYVMLHGPEERKD